MVNEIKQALEEFKGEIVETVKRVAVETVEEKAKEMLIKEQMPPIPEGEKKDMRELLKALVMRDTTVLKALSEGVDSAGGFLVPPEMANKILDIAKDVGYARKYGTVATMSRDTLVIPKLTSKPAVSWVGEGAAITTGEPAFGQVQLTAKKAGIIVPITMELIEDSKFDVVGLVTKIIGEAFAEAEDEQAFVGNGTVFTGILNHPEVAVVTLDTGETAFTNVSADDLINLIAAVPSKVASKGVFVMHRTVFAYLKTLKDGSGRYIFDPASNTIWGYPVITVDAMPAITDSAADKAFIIFGDLKQLYLVDRKKISIALADQATIGSDNLFEKDMVAIRAVERVAIGVAMPQAFAVLKTAAV